MSISLENTVSVIPFWGRSRVSKIIIQNAKDIGLRFAGVCTYTDQENIQLLEDNCEKLIITQNNITGQKWNRGLKYWQTVEDWEYFIILGSDDLISYKYFELIKDREEKYIGLLDAVAMDLQTKRFRHWKGYTNHRQGESIGVARVIHRDILEALNYELFPNILKSRIDSGVEANVRKVYRDGYFFESGLNGLRVGLKSGSEFSRQLPGAPFLYSMPLDDYYSEEVNKLIRDY